MMSDVMTVTLCARIDCSVENHQLYAIKRSCWLSDYRKKFHSKTLFTEEEKMTKRYVQNTRQRFRRSKLISEATRITIKTN